VRFLCLYGGFRGWASECCQSNFTPTDPRCNGKFGTKLVVTQHMYEISPRFLYLTRGFKSGANK